MRAQHRHARRGTAALLRLIVLALLPLLAACSGGNGELKKLQQEAWTQPDNPALLVRLGNAYAVESRYEEASRAYLDALAIDADIDEAYHSLGAVRFNQGNFAEAREWFQKHLERAPEDSLRHYDLGNALMQLQEYEDAASAYSQAIAYSTAFVEAHYNLAVCFTKTGRMAEARQIYDWLLDKNNYLAVSLESHLTGENKED